MPIYTKEQVRAPTGLMKTLSLFHEKRNYHQQDWTPYTLKDYDIPEGLSMHKRYINYASEYEAAMDLLDSWVHWCKLKECNWFKPYYKAWEEERQMRIDAIAERVLLEQAEEGNVTAAKTIADKKKARLRGRPSEAEKKKVAKEEKELDEFLSVALKNVTPISNAKKK